MEPCEKKLIFGASLVVLVCILAAGLVYFGFLQLNHPPRERYPVRGVDVSWYQGEIDWDILSAQDIRFAYIKATEGSGHVDPHFASNLENALKTDLRIGAYHFFSFDSGGETQAENFISIVLKHDNMLPPVVDVEFYGDHEKNPPGADSVRQELSIMLEKLEAHYGCSPVIYVTEKSYNQYIAGYFEDYDLWYRSVYTSIDIPDGRTWTFWQYSNRARLAGYNGEERFIDMNVFHGSLSEFEQYGK